MATTTDSTPAPATRRSVPSRGKPKKDSRWGNPIVYVAALVLIGLMLGPVLYIIAGGFRTNSQITANPAGLPNPWVFRNYSDVLSSSTFWRQVGNSTMAAVATTIGIVVLGVMASYVLARYQFRGRGAMYALFAAGLMFPITVAITPLYILANGAAAIGTGPDHRRDPRVHRQLEQLPAAAVHPEQPEHVHPAAGRAGVRVSVLGRHREGARVHLVVDDPGVG